MPNSDSINNALSYLEALRNANTTLSYKEICKFSDEQKSEYNTLLDNFIDLNGSSDVGNPSLNSDKGKSLERLATFLIEKSGGIFEVEANIKTTTNEIDQIIRVNQTGRILIGNNLLDKRLQRFVSECKNYKKAVDVTFVGKLCSLLITNGVKIGIMFSYYGISGHNWNYGSGLVRKFYLSKENVDDRFCIIDFNIEDFEKIRDGSNLLELIESKILGLQFDTDYSRFLPKSES